MADGSNICPVCGARALAPSAALMPEESSQPESPAERRTFDPDEEPEASASAGSSKAVWLLAILLLLATVGAGGLGVLMFFASAKLAAQVEETRAMRQLAEAERVRAEKSAEQALEEEKQRADALKAVTDKAQRLQADMQRVEKQVREQEGPTAQKLERAQHEIYLGQIARVEAAWERDPSRGLRLLGDTESCPVEYRDFAWGLYRQLCTAERFAARGHNDFVTGVAVSPKADVGASVSGQTIKLWDLVQGKEKATLTGHSQAVHGLLFSPDGKLLASRCENPGSPSGELILWDVESAKLRANLRGHRVPVTGMAFSQDGKTLISSSGESNNLNGTAMEVKAWNTETNKEKGSFPSHARGQGFFAVAISPDGKRAAGGTGGTTQPGEIVLWDLEANKELATLKGHADWVTALEFTADGKTLISGGRDGAVKLWDVEAGKDRATLTGHTDLVIAIQLLSDGKGFASWTKNEVKVWDLPGGIERLNLSAPLPNACSFSVSPDSRTLALRTLNSEQLVEISVWDLGTGTKRTTFKAASLTGKKDDDKINVESLAFTPNGRALFSGWTDGTVRLWNVRTGQDSASFQAHPRGEVALAISPDGKLLASGGIDGQIRLGNPALADAPQQVLKGHEAPITSLVFSPDGTLLVSADSAKTNESGGVIKIWDLARGGMDTGERINDSTAPIMAVALAPDADRLAWGNQRGDVKLISRSGKAKKVEITNPGKVNGLAFSPDGKYLAIALADRTVNVWDVAAAQPRLVLKGHGVPVNAVAFSPDGKLLASAAGEKYVAPGDTPRPGELKIWDLETGKERVPVRGQLPLRALAIAFSPDGKSIATGSADRNVRLWDVTTGREETALAGHAAAVTSVVFSPDGKLLISASEDGVVKTWESATEAKK
jgi:WD40 repeat protein